MIEISSEVFMVGPTRAQSYNTIMYKAVHMTYEVSPSLHSQGLFKTQRDHCKTNRGKADHQTSNPNFISYICRKDILGATLIPTYKLPKLSGYAIRCWGYRGSIISHPKLANPTSSCIHPSTHNQETFGNRVPQPSKSIRYTSYGNTPELPPQYWVASRLSHQQLHKRDFRCWRTQVFQNCNDKIMTTTHQSSTPRDTSTKPLTGGTKTVFSS